MVGSMLSNMKKPDSNSPLTSFSNDEELDKVGASSSDATSMTTLRVAGMCDQKCMPSVCENCSVADKGFAMSGVAGAVHSAAGED